MSQHLPAVSHQTTSEMNKILHNLSIKKQNQIKPSTNFINGSIFSLKMSKYDFDAKQKCKFQLRNQSPPSKWKASTNQNAQFSRNEATKGKILTGWDMQRVNMSKRSYEQPKQFHGVKSDLFSRQFPQDLSKTYSKGFNKKLKQIQLQYEKKVFEGNIKTIQEKRQKSIDAIKSRGTRLQLSKDKLFGFTNVVKSSPPKHNRFHSTMSHFYQGSSPNKII